MWTKAKEFLHGPSFKLYCSYGLSSWGERMWLFASGLALALVGGDLRLPAISGLIDDAAVFLFASYVGSWIDRTPRFTAAATCLTITNFCVATAAGSLAAMINWCAYVRATPSVYYTLMAVALVFTAVSKLSQAGTRICLTKDWVVVIAGKDYDDLAKMNAMLLRLNLTTMTISPMLAGIIMSAVDMSIGCLFLAGWNICSFCVEMLCLWSIYRSVPQLAKSTRFIQKASGKEVDSDERDDSADEFVAIVQPDDDYEPKARTSGCRTMCSQFGETLSHTFKSWKLYYDQDVFTAGIALGVLYMTVLGWDSITTSYAYYQGIPENVVAAITAAAAILGICGSIAYPFMRRRFGLSRSTLMSLSMQDICLSLCVISIWLPGSPFDPVGYYRGHYAPSATNTTDSNSSYFSNVTQTAQRCDVPPSDTIAGGSTAAMGTVSIWVFLMGICLARFGLWIADLCISQLFQELVEEHQRGVVNGVQNSFNQLMDMVKNILVIVFPAMQTFGLLIMASYTAVVLGLVSMCAYNIKTRGHLFHFEKVYACLNIEPPSILGKIDGTNEIRTANSNNIEEQYDNSAFENEAKA